MSVYDRASSSPEQMRRFQSARLEMEITELICELLEKQQVTRAELAKRLGTSQPYITKILRGNTNLTLKTISDIFFALGRSVRIVDRPLSISSPRLRVEDEPSAITSAATGTDGASVARHDGENGCSQADQRETLEKQGF
jgi:transcriptional regulator with XRE-family HTH domain